VFQQFVGRRKTSGSGANDNTQMRVGGLIFSLIRCGAGRSHDACSRVLTSVFATPRPVRIVNRIICANP